MAFGNADARVRKTHSEDDVASPDESQCFAPDLFDTADEVPAVQPQPFSESRSFPNTQSDLQARPRKRVSLKTMEYPSDDMSMRQRGRRKTFTKDFAKDYAKDYAKEPRRSKPIIRNSKDVMNSDSDCQFDAAEDVDLSNIPADKIVFVNDYIRMQIPELRDVACELGLDRDRVFELKKQELVTEILKFKAYAGCNIRSVGTLEILPEGSFGFLRSEINSYLPGPEDVFVSPQLIKSYALKTGDVVSCMLRNPQASERFFAVQKILSVNDCDPALARGRVPFDSLTPLYPDSIINLEGMKKDISMRIVNLFAPIGKGQRALITAPPRTGKTILLQKIANAITDNYPDVKLLVLLVDERPEEVTDMRRNVKGEVIASTFDEQAQRHVSVAEMVIEKAKRQVEYGKDVVILLDSITRLARAYNQTAPASGKVLSGGVDSNALHKPKRFFGAARNIENGGSLTIIASALIETGSRMDEVIFEEFKGTGNCEIVLDRRISDKRVYPAINLKKSGTRKEELLIEQDDLAKIWLLRNAINSMDDVDMTEFVIEKMKRYESNHIFLGSMMNSK
ncbi:MAG TPA: transcription termination factor Rho [Spirochaetaceae bacterium]|nr:transcription termination factor Rho [Spirochaetaceae bacterium]